MASTDAKGDWAGQLLPRVVFFVAAAVLVSVGIHAVPRTADSGGLRASLTAVLILPLWFTLSMLRGHIQRSELEGRRVRGLAIVLAVVTLGVTSFAFATGLGPRSVAFPVAAIGALALSHLLNEFRSISDRRRPRAILFAFIGVCFVAGGLFVPSVHPATGLLVAGGGVISAYFGLVTATEYIRPVHVVKPARRSWAIGGIVLLTGAIALMQQQVGGNARPLVIVLAVVVIVGLAITRGDSDLVTILLAIAIWWAVSPTTADVSEGFLPDPAPVQIGEAQPGGAADDEDDILLVMGDSFISGEGAQQFITGTNDRGGNECRRAETGYHHLLVAVKEKARFDFWITESREGLSIESIPNHVISVACSGAVAANIISEAQYEYQPPLRSTDDDPPLSQTQLELAETYLATSGGRDPSMIMLSIGGNDALFATLVTSCLGPGNCADIGQYFVDQLGGVRTEVLAVYNEVTSTYPDARVLVIPYPTALEVTDCQALLTRSEAAFIDEFITMLNNQIRDSVTAHNDLRDRNGRRVEFVGTVQVALSATNTLLCDKDATGDIGMNFLEAAQVGGSFIERLNPLSWVHNSVHPNELGHEKIAEAIARYENACAPKGSERVDDLCWARPTCELDQGLAAKGAGADEDEGEDEDDPCRVDLGSCSTSGLAEGICAKSPICDERSKSVLPTDKPEDRPGINCVRSPSCVNPLPLATIAGSTEDDDGEGCWKPVTCERRSQADVAAKLALEQGVLPTIEPGEAGRCGTEGSVCTLAAVESSEQTADEQVDCVERSECTSVMSQRLIQRDSDLNVDPDDASIRDTECPSRWMLLQMRTVARATLLPLLLAIAGAWALGVSVLSAVDGIALRLERSRRAAVGVQTEEPGEVEPRPDLFSRWIVPQQKWLRRPSAFARLAKGIQMLMAAVFVLIILSSIQWTSIMSVAGLGLLQFVLLICLLLAQDRERLAQREKSASLDRTESDDSRPSFLSQFVESRIHQLGSTPTDTFTVAVLVLAIVIAIVAAALPQISLLQAGMLIGGLLLVTLVPKIRLRWRWDNGPAFFDVDQLERQQAQEEDEREDPFRSELRQWLRIYQQFRYPMIGLFGAILFTAVVILDASGLTVLGLALGLALAVAFAIVTFPMVVSRPRSRSSQVGLLAGACLFVIAAGSLWPSFISRSDAAPGGTISRDLPLLPGALTGVALLIGAALVDGAIRPPDRDRSNESFMEGARTWVNSIATKQISDVHTSQFGTVVGLAVAAVGAKVLDGSQAYAVFAVSVIAIVIHWWAVFMRHTGHLWPYAIVGVVVGIASVELVWQDGWSVLGRSVMAVIAVYAVARMFSLRTLRLFSATMIGLVVVGVYLRGTSVEDASQSARSLTRTLKDGVISAWDAIMIDVFNQMNPARPRVVWLLAVAIAGALLYRWMETVNNRRLATPVAVAAFETAGDFGNGALLTSQFESELARAGITDPPFVPTSGIADNLIAVVDQASPVTALPQIGAKLAALAFAPRGTVVMPTLDRADDGGAEITVRIKDARTNAIRSTASFIGSDPSDAIRRAVAFVAQQTLAANDTTPKWARWQSEDGVALRLYLEAQRESRFTEELNSEERAKRLIAAISASPSTGLVRVELGHVYDMRNERWGALRIHLEAALAHPRLVQANYRVATTLSMLAGELTVTPAAITQVDRNDRVVVEQLLQDVLKHHTNDDAPYLKDLKDAMLGEHAGNGEAVAGAFIDAAEDMASAVLRITSTPVLLLNALVHADERNHWLGLLKDQDLLRRERGRYLMLRLLVRLRRVDLALHQTFARRNENVADEVKKCLEIAHAERTQANNIVDDYGGAGTIYNAACMDAIYIAMIERHQEAIGTWCEQDVKLAETAHRLFGKDTAASPEGQPAPDVSGHIAECKEKAVKRLLAARSDYGPGFPAAHWIFQDPDLKSLHGTELFEELRRWLRQGDVAVAAARAPKPATKPATPDSQDNSNE